MPIEMIGRRAELLLCAAMGNPVTTAMYEGLCAGSSTMVVRGVVVCYAPTLELLRRAATEKKNLIVSREHPFFLHGGWNYAYATGGVEAALKDDPVAQAKRDIITANQMMVYRFGTYWDQFRPKAQSLALAAALGFTPITPPPTPRARGVTCGVPETTMLALAQSAVARLKISAPRVVGSLNTKVTRVAVIPGETDPKETLAQVLEDPKIDGVIAGAGGVLDEVDGAVSYFQDVVASGRRIALLAIGYGPSHDPGCAEMARWMQKVLPYYSVEWWPTQDPSWIPRS
jgi:putative NIF3 family GTP cyclohydrolase 1 type 2